MENQQQPAIEYIKPQPRIYDRVHGDYAALSDGEKRDKAFAKLQAFIDAGTPAAAAAIARIMGETPEDRLVRARSMEFLTTEGADEVRLALSNHAPLALHPHALHQIGARVGIPAKFVGDLATTDWGRRLLAENLGQLYAHKPAEDERVLVRAVDGKVRGVLSNGYRTDDSRPALDALIGVAQEAGAVIAGGSALDVRTSVKVMLAKPVEIFPGEWAVFGLDYRNSDYGAGAREICGWILRLLCLNGAVTTANFRRVHLGARNVDEVEYSNRTRALNAAATVSATRDMARSMLAPENVAKMIDRVRAANASELDPDKAIASIRKDVNKGEEKAIVAKFNSPDVELLPAGQTKWRFSNAISWLANQTPDASRKLDLERLAGNVLEAA